MQGYRFVFQRGTTTRVPFQFQTVNPDKTRTPINLSGKRVSIVFRVRGAEDLLALDSSQTANQFGAKIEITNAAEGRFQVFVPTAQIERFAVGAFGEYELLLHDSNGDSQLLAEGSYGVR